MAVTDPDPDTQMSVQDAVNQILSLNNKDNVSDALLVNVPLPWMFAIFITDIVSTKKGRKKDYKLLLKINFSCIGLQYQQWWSHCWGQKYELDEH